MLDLIVSDVKKQERGNHSSESAVVSGQKGDKWYRPANVICHQGSRGELTESKKRRGRKDDGDSIREM